MGRIPGKPNGFQSKRGFKYYYLRGQIALEPGPPHLGDCWIYLGTQNHDGYGQIRNKRNGKWINVSAQKHFFELYRETVPKGFEVAHVCHRRLCVRPRHLGRGTVHQNRLDRHVMPVFNNSELATLLALLAEGLPHSQIADQLRCPRLAIAKLARRLDWRELDLFQSSVPGTDLDDPISTGITTPSDE